MQQPFAAELWHFLTARKRISGMASATADGKPAIVPLIDEIESKFGTHCESREFPHEEVTTFINNMIKQIMEHSGYKYVGCGIIRGARYFKNSGVYQKLDAE
jgi:hypothetical protein